MHLPACDGAPRLLVGAGHGQFGRGLGGVGSREGQLRGGSWCQQHLSDPLFPVLPALCLSCDLAAVGPRRHIGGQVAYRYVRHKYFYLPLSGHLISLMP